MPISRTGFLRVSALLMVVGLLALLAIVGTTFWLAERSSADFASVIEARTARTTTVNLRNALQIAESSQRGYLLTGEESYLDPYNRVRGDIRGYFERMTEATQRFGLGVDRIDPLRQAIIGKVQEMDRTIELRRAGQTDEAFDLLRSDHGKALMDEADQLFTAIISAADEHLTRGVQRQSENQHALRWIAGLGGIVILVVAGGSVWLALRYTSELVQARAEVDALNLGLEARIRERTQDLIRANEEVQRFAYIVTHDLRAPLVNIMGFTSELDTTMKSIQAYILAEPGKASETVVEDARLAAAEDLPEAIGFIRSSTRKMDGLINAILKISRDGRRPLKPEQIDVKALVEANLATLQHQIAADDGQSEIDVKVRSIVSDRMSVEQIVGNLLDNAVKYRAPDRPLRVEVEAARLPAGRVRIAVSDNGRGIAPQDHQRVFDLFRRAGTQDQPGEGIGLAHVRTLARNLGGDISVTSEFGVGSTFTVELPADLRSVVRSEAS